MQINTEQGGMAIEHDGAGNVSVSLQRIREVGVASMAEVICHDVVRVAGLVSHHMKLCNGGEVTFAFNQVGQIVALSASRVTVTMTQDHRVLIRALVG